MTELLMNLFPTLIFRKKYADAEFDLNEFVLFQPRQLKGKSPKGIDVPRMMMPSNDSGMLDVSASDMQEKIDVSQVKVEMPQNISHPEMPDITKRLYDMEQPLDLGPLKKKVFFS